jgi:hypothetical protein
MTTSTSETPAEVDLLITPPRLGAMLSCHHRAVIIKSELLFGVEVSPRRQQDHAALDEYEFGRVPNLNVENLTK